MEKPTIGSVANYFGSNRMLASKPAEIIGKTDWVGIPFAGSMAEVPFFQSRSIVCNDRHRAVLNLCAVIKNEVDRRGLYAMIMDTPFHESQLQESQNYCKRYEALTDETRQLFSKFQSTIEGETIAPNLEWAYHYFICAWMSRSGTAGTKNEFNGSMSVRWEGSGGGSAKRFYSAARSLVQWRRCFQRCEFTCMDGFEFIDRALKSDKDGYERAIYCDPPFDGGPGDAYKHSFSAGQHERLHDSLSRFKHTKIVVRYYATERILSLYANWKVHRFEGRKQTNDKAPEILIERTP